MWEERDSAITSTAAQELFALFTKMNGSSVFKEGWRRQDKEVEWPSGGGEWGEDSGGGYG